MKLMGKFILIVFASVLLQSCGFYSLTGYAINGETASIIYFENQAPIQSAELSQIFTNKLEQKIIQETPLKLVKEEGDLQFSGAITGYQIRPVAVTDVDTTEQSELRITINVTYVDTIDDKKSFNESFAATETFDANSDLSSVEFELFESITEQIVQAIFNRAFIDW